MNANGSVSPHNYKENKKTDNNEAISTDQKASIAYNISINVTDTDSPSYVRRRIHLRSLSDVTPASRAHTPRARSHSERPRATATPSPSRPAPRSPVPQPHTGAPGMPRFVRSERSSPDTSLLTLEEPLAHSEAGLTRRFGARDRSSSDAVSVLGNPWRKMSEVDIKSAAARGRVGGRSGLDPWVKIPSPRADSSCDRAMSKDEASRGTSDTEQKRESSTFKRGKLERKSPVVCESCGNESCECWRTNWSRGARAIRSLGAQCTCDARSPRPSPARLRPRAAPRALSDDEDRPRRLYKSASQKLITTSMDGDRGKKTDPLLETTC